MPAHDRSTFSNLSEDEYAGMQEISVQQLHQTMLAHDPNVVVLDVRDPHEWAISALPGTLRIPKGEIQQAKNAVLAGRKLREETVLAQIPQDKTLLIHCRSGKRKC
ncbi:hypothetical protein HC776_01875 [bacterium]|nr:hypothetical protein [bacterium]